LVFFFRRLLRTSPKHIFPRRSSIRIFPSESFFEIKALPFRTPSEPVEILTRPPNETSLPFCNGPHGKSHDSLVLPFSPERFPPPCVTARLCRSHFARWLGPPRKRPIPVPFPARACSRFEGKLLLQFLDSLPFFRRVFLQIISTYRIKEGNSPIIFELRPPFFKWR